MRRAELQAICQAEKENRASNKRKQLDDGLQKAEISYDECAVCFGTYDEDVIDGELRREWIQCTNLDCNKWMHSECLVAADSQVYICYVCKNTSA